MVNEEHRKQRVSHLRWVEISDIIPAPLAQREFSLSWASKLASQFNLEGMGYPVVSLRDGMFYVVDGQHRIAALRILGFEEDTIQCEVYEGLTQEEEAELFLERNYNKAVSPFDKFTKAVNAGRATATEIDRIVRAQGLHISRTRREGGISAVASLQRVHGRQGPAELGRVLRIIRDAYGSIGFEGIVIDGLSLCLHRYDGQVEDAPMVERLLKTNGGVNGLLQPAERYHIKTGQPRPQCIAAALVDIYNRAKGGKKLAPWWKE